MEIEQKLNIDYYIEMFKSDPKKDMKKGKILKKTDANGSYRILQ